MTTSSTPKPLHPKKPEPIGWDYENVKVLEEPISDTWFFSPWSNIEFKDPWSTPVDAPSKLLLAMVKPVEKQYWGSGIIVSSVDGSVIGCYKIHADTERGHNDKMQLKLTKDDIESAVTDGLSMISIPEAVQTPEQTVKLDQIKEELTEGPVEVRRLNGLLLDPRPQWIARHQKEAFKLHNAMAGQPLYKYADQYLPLENKIRRAMGQTFDPKQDLPVYRQKELGIKTGPDDDTSQGGEHDQDDD